MGAPAGGYSWEREKDPFQSGRQQLTEYQWMSERTWMGAGMDGAPESSGDLRTGRELASSPSSSESHRLKKKRLKVQSSRGVVESAEAARLLPMSAVCHLLSLTLRLRAASWAHIR